MNNANRVDMAELYTKCSVIRATTLPIGDGNDKFEFVVKHRLNATEVSGIIETVSNGVIDSETDAYHPELKLKDYYLRVAVISTYTNIDLPEANGECWDMVYGTPVFAMVAGHENRPVIFENWDYDCPVIDVEQYEQILNAIDKKIDYILMRGHMGGK